MWSFEFWENVSPWIRVPVAIGLILLACAILHWAPGGYGRFWGFPVALGVVLLILGGWSEN
jgi:hypothetical protein